MTDIDEQYTQALQQHFASHAVIISYETAGLNYGTGVAVKFKGQNYIITAAHVLDDKPRNDKILIVGKPDSVLQLVPKREIHNAVIKGTYGPIKSSRGIPINITKRHTNKALGDIAALKVQEPEKMLSCTTFYDLTNQQEVDIAEGTQVVICGFPRELGLHARHRANGQRHMGLFTYFARQKIKAISEAPEMLDSHIDFLTDFGLDHETCEPKGMSGGGAWTLPKINQSKLWFPDQAKLVGVQVGFYRKPHLLRLVRIERVLDLLSSDQLSHTA